MKKLTGISALLGVMLLGIAPILPTQAQVVQEWVSTYNYGAPGNDGALATAIAVDDGGYVYVTGVSHRTNLDDTGDYATIKYSSDGMQLWVARYNGSGDNDDEPQALLVDPVGNVYVTGYSFEAGTGYDMCTIKYDPNGNQLWISTYNGPANGSDIAYALGLDSQGNVYITGCSRHDLSVQDSYNLALVKYSSIGTQEWVSLLSGPGNGKNCGYALALDQSGNIYVTGQYHIGPSFFNYDCLTAKYSPSGILVWLDHYDSHINNEDWGEDLVVDTTGYVYVLGTTNRQGGYPDYDFLTIKYDFSGVRQWIRTFNTILNQQNSGHAIALNPEGGVYVTGRCFMIYSADENRATVKYDSAGTQEWAVTAEGCSFDIAADIQGNAYITGYGSGATTQKYSSHGVEQWCVSYETFPGSETVTHSIAVDINGNVYITGSTDMDPGFWPDIAFLTIKYNQSNPYTVNLTPINPPIQIPAAGGSFSYNVTIENNGPSIQTFAVWCMTLLPSNTWYGPVVGPITLTLASGTTLTRLRTQYVPTNAPAGDYLYETRLGDYPGGIWTSDSFPFTKLETGDGTSGIEKWSSSGDPFPGEEIAWGEEIYNSSLITYNLAPNPFNPTTAFNYELRAASFVNLRVYDTAGRLVKTLVEGLQEVGGHRVTFNGSRLPSGVYLYHLQAGEVVASGKMVLLK